MSKLRNRITDFSVSIFLLSALSVPAIAQIDRGSLSGTVTDPGGDAVAGAKVTVVETGTQTTRQTVTDSNGSYTVLVLPAGNYSLTVSHSGFETLTEQDISLAGGENKRANAQLVVGRVTQQVEVTSQAPSLETREGTNSLSESSETLSQLPLEVSGAKRDATQYMTALPGYQTGNGFNDQVNGSISGYNEVYVDGTPEEINAAAHGATRNFFSAEGVDEIKVVTTPMADLGNIGGVAVSFITKSGTNALHGSGYGLIRNTAFDSSCDQFCPGAKPVDHQGEYGFALGGPLWIPHIYNGKNKTFWFFNWGHYYYTYSVGASFYGVPTSAMKGGDFSSFLQAGPIGTDSSGNPVYAGEIFDPRTHLPYGSGTGLNHIPAADFSSVASKYQAFFPAPTSAGNPPTNYTVAGGAGKSPDTYYQIDINQNIRDRDHLSGTYWYDNTTPVPVLQLPLVLEVASEGGPIGHFAHLNWAHTFNSNLVNEASFGWDRNSSPILSPPIALTGASLIGEVNPLGPCTPSFSIAGGYMTSNRSDFLCSQAEGDSNFEINDTVSLVKGKHLIKWGFNLIHFDANFPRISNLSAGFLAAETSTPNSATCPNCAAQTGNSYASFLIGAVDNAQTQGVVASDPRILQYGVYGQDEFKITPRLTVTYALRYDIQPFPVERHNAVSQFEPTLPNPGAGNIPGAVAFLGFGPGTLNTRHAAPNYYFSTNFGPKLGFAYQLMTNTVVRGAATLAYGPINQTMAGFANEFQQGYFPTFTTASPNGFAPSFYLDNGFPFPAGVPLYNDFSPTVANGGGTNFFGKTSDKAPRIFNTHLAIEHQFPGRVVVGLHYNGAYVHGIITGAGQPLNQLNYGTYAGYGQACLSSDITAQTGCPRAIPLPYPTFTGTVAQALRPFPQYQDIENQSAPTGWSTYTGFQVTAKKDYENGLSFLVGYTLEHQYSDLNNTPGYFSAPAQNAYNPNAEKAPAYADMPNQVLFNYTYQLPIGEGKRVNISNRALNAAAGGWAIAGIHTYESGTPNSISSETTLFSQPETATNGNSVRPNLVPGQPIRTRISCGSFNPAGGNSAVSDTYLNSAAFVMPGPLQFGDTPRALGNARSCPYFNENVTLFKSFAITEKVNFRLGADFFNLFNRHVWGGPNTDVQSPDFGKIFGLNGNPRSIQFNGRLSF